ncbi:hypothetical protein CJ195_04980 [Bacillus sp. UMB0899]|uniref:hypothetical protein n=1 Tax=Metabacillus schmidteae TaxID=2730405 RepID=UPI000C7FA094|nr:hypothetical protein [Metabacillus schmidteae]PMC39287.1 hypothetical protein CJ195_04980 [Bacillus sp. UMB0899]
MKKVLQIGALVLLSGILAQNPGYVQKENQSMSQIEKTVTSDQKLERTENGKKRVVFIDDKKI